MATKWCPHSENTAIICTATFDSITILFIFSIYSFEFRSLAHAAITSSWSSWKILRLNLLPKWHWLHKSVWHSREVPRVVEISGGLTGKLQPARIFFLQAERVHYARCPLNRKQPFSWLSTLYSKKQNYKHSFVVICSQRYRRSSIAKDMINWWLRICLTVQLHIQM